MKTWLFDTGIWLRTLTGKTSMAASKIMEDPSTRVLTSPLSIAEIASVSTRRGQGKRVDEFVSHIRRLSIVRGLDAVDCEAGGRIHAAERARHRDFSMVDSMILAQAKADKATVLTTDRRLAANHQGVRVKVI